MPESENPKYWSLSSDAALQEYQSTRNGLTTEEASSRLRKYGANAVQAQKKTTPLVLFLSQLKNPIILILLVATGISAATGDVIDSLIIVAIIMASLVLSFLQEYSASNAIEKLRATMQVKSTALRSGKTVEIFSDTVVPGDVIQLFAGSLIPADGLVLSFDNFFVNQSILTGESYPAEKKTEAVPEDTSLSERRNCVYMGTSVSSGTATMLVTQTGASTEFGEIAKQLTLRPPETEFERGVRHFGYFLTEIMLFLTFTVFAVNVLTNEPAIDSLLFSVALAVGITPQLLPAIISITLSKGARIMAKEGVIVRRLAAIENFGSMDVLCTDKTGTLTEGVVRFDDAVDVSGQPSDAIFRLAYLNASLQVGLPNSLDRAVINARRLNSGTVQKLDEIPYDFTRKRLSIVIKEGDQCTMVTKGALKNILDICDHAEVDNVRKELDRAAREAIQQRFAAWSDQGIRVLGVSQKAVPEQENYEVQEEKAMVFMGFLLFFDPPKADVAQTISELTHYGVQLRIITGDNKLVAMHTATAVGLEIKGVLTGSELLNLSEESLWSRIETTTLFAEVDPNQKERIILALKKKNHVVGYMGDGINDAPALHAADVSISVSTAVDVAKEAADFVLLEQSLSVLKRGIELGRTTLANTLKYISITTSANFGNMFSMAGSSLFLPFLPLLPKQILLINFLTDFPALTIANDAVDPEVLDTALRWNIKSIRNFMLVFGLISSAFDYLTFAVLLIGFKAGEELFQSSWFILSILTELLILLVMRTHKPFFKSRPAPLLLFSTIGVGMVTLVLPYLPLRSILSISPIPLPKLVILLSISLLYIIVTEIAKHYFYRREKTQGRKVLVK